ncbi:MAG: hypothetical protein ACF8Q5_05280 [Phycisphaerales bacterium JB040]
MCARDAMLVIETSNPSAHEGGAFVALARSDGTLIESERLDAARGGRDDLHPAIGRVSARAGIGPERLARVAVSVGPGGYTGLRVAVAAAAMIAEATGSEIVALPSDRVAARSVALSVAPTPRAVVLASKGETCHVSVQRDDRAFETVGVVRAGAFEGLGLACVLGDRHLPRGVRERLGELGVPVVPVRFEAWAACALASEAEPIDPLALRVRYAREPDAVTQWRARHGSG